VDGGEEEESGEDDGDGGACHHLLLHCYLCVVSMWEQKRRAKYAEKNIDKNRYMQNEVTLFLFLFLVTLLLTLFSNAAKKNKK